MNRAVKTILIIIITSVVFAIITGCEPEGTTENPKKERLYAAENIELKKQIDQMKKTHQSELAANQQLLDSCLEENQMLTQQIEQNTADILNDEITTMMMNETQRLQQENESLMAQIDELKKQLNSRAVEE